MLKQTVFPLLMALMILYGSVFTMKYFGWPSMAERNNKIVRSLRTGLSSSVLLLGLFLFYFYWTSPGTFFNQWTINTIIGGFLFCAAPIFAVLTIFSFIQFSALEKMQSGMKTRLGKIKDDSSKNNNGRN